MAKTKETQEVEAKAIRPADLATELEVSPKALRAFLRREFPRANEAKNTSWTLNSDMVKAATDHFTASDDEDGDDEA